jgi:hypothetical protein
VVTTAVAVTAEVATVEAATAEAATVAACTSTCTASQRRTYRYSMCTNHILRRSLRGRSWCRTQCQPEETPSRYSTSCTASGP